MHFLTNFIQCFNVALQFVSKEHTHLLLIFTSAK